MDERAIIDTVFKPLAGEGAPALGLENDTAIYTPPEGCDLVLTKDVMIEGVHFLTSENAGVIAKRLLRANLSDLAASGAKPVGYLLGLVGKKAISDQWLRAFAASLRADQEEFGITLFGGDTTSGSDSLCLSLTALGTVKAGTALTRKGAKPGDLVFVSGTIGDAHLGLKCLKGEVARDDYLIGRFQKPEPRLRLGQELAGLASASIDISDGLVLDMENLARASGVGARVLADNIPLSETARKHIGGDRQKLISLITAGDDYELLFTVPASRRESIAGLARKAGLPISEIGEITESEICEIINSEGKAIDFGKKGYRHFE